MRCIIRGSLACFARPESPDRYSTPVIPPSAVHGIISAIHDHPGLFPDIRSISVLNPIRYTQRSYAYIGKVSTYQTRGKKLVHPQGDRYTTVESLLVDPKWLIEFEWRSIPKMKGYPKTKFGRCPAAAFRNVDLAKATAIFTRRVEKGQFYYTPSLGLSQYRALVEPVTGKERPISQTRDFGMLLHGIDFRTRPVTPYVFRAKMIDGVIEVPSFFDAVLRDSKEAA